MITPLKKVEAKNPVSYPHFTTGLFTEKGSNPQSDGEKNVERNSHIGHISQINYTSIDHYEQKKGIDQKVLLLKPQIL
ncbi:MAG: hypothetical protein HOP10_06315 [Chitinophagaceae bacterium]|nr:hypothetical protein [Chitinophagaceae bacterium]